MKESKHAGGKCVSLSIDLSFIEKAFPGRAEDESHMCVLYVMYLNC